MRRKLATAVQVSCSRRGTGFPQNPGLNRRGGLRTMEGPVRIAAVILWATQHAALRVPGVLVFVPPGDEWIDGAAQPHLSELIFESVLL